MTQLEAQIKALEKKMMGGKAKNVYALKSKINYLKMKQRMASWNNYLSQ
jgi:hypothetical protein